MNKRKVTFTVDVNGNVLPSIPQYGGIKGEHCATELTFRFLSTFTEGVGKAFYEEGQILRLIFSSGDGSVVSSDMLQDTVFVDNMTPTISYSLPRTVTVPSGQLSVRAAVSTLDEETGEEVQLCQSTEAVLYFDDAAVENGTPFWRGVSEMLAGTVSACETTRKLRDETQTLYEKATEEMETIRDDTQEICQKAVEDMQEIRSQTTTEVAETCEAAINEVSDICKQAVIDTALIRDATTVIRDETAAIRDETAGIRDETEVMLKEHDFFRYCGTASGAMLEGLSDQQIGDVYTVSDDGKLYVWTGQQWYRLADHLIRVDGTTLTIL